MLYENSHHLCVPQQEYGSGRAQSFIFQLAMKKNTQAITAFDVSFAFLSPLY